MSIVHDVHLADEVPRVTNQPDNIQVSAKLKKKKTKKQKEREGKDELMRTMSNTSAKYQLAFEGSAVVVQKNQVKKKKNIRNVTWAVSPAL